MKRVLLLLCMLLPTVARADAPPPEVKPVATSDEAHKISVVAQGAVGGAAVLSAGLGLALFLHSHEEYRIQLDSSGGLSCRPCTNSDLTSMRIEEYVGFGFLALGGALLVADVALIAIDATSHGHEKRRVASAGRQLALGVRF
jgi:hypothetical protein